ncbi:MAG TPA: response regulator [Rubrivivax sp.]|nr:response regulator [Rubrivivax sp.]
MTGRLPHRTIGRKMSKTYRVALLGFSQFERSTLASYFRLATQRDPSYALVFAGDDSDFILADADHAASVQLVQTTERLGETVFIGTQAPADAVAWMMRPIDPLHVMRELDAMLLQRGGSVDPAAAKGSAVPPAPALPPPAPPAGPAALLVDDSALALRFLASRLQPWGLSVEGVSSSGKAVERLAHRNYEFVFIDVELGAESELDGLALCQHIKRHHPLAGSLLVMVSAHHSELDRVRGTLAGCDAYLGKPLQAAELERLLLRQGLKPPPAPPSSPAVPAGGESAAAANPD